MKFVKDRPADKYFLHKLEKCDTLQKRRVLPDAVNAVMDRYFDYSTEGEERGEDQGKKDKDKNDHVCEYSHDVLMMRMMYMEFVDAIQEGDGGRILCCWQYLLLIFKATESIETFILLALNKFIFTMHISAILSNCCGEEPLTHMSIKMYSVTYVHIEHLYNIE